MDWPTYKILRAPSNLWQIYKLWNTNADGSAEYKLYPEGNDYQWFKTKKDAQDKIKELETNGA